MRPKQRILFLFLIQLGVALLATFSPSLFIGWQIYSVLLILLLMYDAWQLRRIPALTIQRHVSGSLPLGVWSEVELVLYNPTARLQRLELIDDYPLPSEIQGIPQTLTLPATTEVTLRYRIQPQQRGSTHFPGVHLRISSPWELWDRYHYNPLCTSVRVYPNFARVTKYALLATENHLGQLGIRQLRRRGEGLEFHQLREYRSGDTLRQINWNATSRLKKLISKEYQEERDQQVIFLLDCGRRMRAQDDTLTHFDHTLNALLLLTYVALRQGDALGLLTFSGEQRWVAPHKGIATLNFVLNTVYDLQPSLHASDYLQAATHLSLRHRRRALVILISNLRDEENDELLPAVQLLRRKHLVLVVSLQEQPINEVLAQPVVNFTEALRYTATQNYLHHRRQAHLALRNQGILCLDVEPKQLAIKMVNQYLEIKRSGIL